MAIASHPNLVENAFVAVLAGQNPNPWAADLNIQGGGLRIFPGETNLDKDGTRIVAYIPGNEMGEEDPPTSGNRWCDCVIELRTPTSRANGATNLANHQANAAALQAVILNINLPDLLSSAIQNFACFGLVDRTPMEEQAEDYWMAGYKVRLLSCPSTIPA